MIHNHFLVLYDDNAQRLLQALSSSRTPNPFPDDLYPRVADPVATTPTTEDGDPLVAHLDLPVATGAHLRYHGREDGMFHIARPYAYAYIRAHYRPNEPHSTFSINQFYQYMVGVLTPIHATIPYSLAAIEGCGDGCNRCAARLRPDVPILPKHTIASTAKSTTQWSWSHRDELVGHVAYHHPPTTQEQSRRGIKSGKVRRAMTRDRNARILHQASQGHTYNEIARNEKVSPSTVCRVVHRVKRAIQDDMDHRQPPLSEDAADGMMKDSWVRIYRRFDLQPETDPTRFYQQYLPRLLPVSAPPTPPVNDLTTMTSFKIPQSPSPTPLIWFLQLHRQKYLRGPSKLTAWGLQPLEQWPPNASIVRASGGTTPPKPVPRPVRGVVGPVGGGHGTSGCVADPGRSST